MKLSVAVAVGKGPAVSVAAAVGVDAIVAIGEGVGSVTGGAGVHIVRPHASDMETTTPIHGLRGRVMVRTP